MFPFSFWFTPTPPVPPAQTFAPRIVQEERLTSVRPQKIAPGTPVSSVVPVVPFYSQFTDISSPKWRGVGCGIVSLAMLIEYYEPGAVTVDQLLARGIDAGAFLPNAGWKHRDLVNLSRRYGLDGNNYDLSGESKSVAYATLKRHLADGPVMVSVHYKFDPKSTIPHLAVINGIADGKVYHNDPAGKKSGVVSEAEFLAAWKKRFIVIRPANETHLSLAR